MANLRRGLLLALLLVATAAAVWGLCHCPVEEVKPGSGPDDGSPGPNPSPGIDDDVAFAAGFLTGFALSFGFLTGSACTYVYLRFSFLAAMASLRRRLLLALLLVATAAAVWRLCHCPVEEVQPGGGPDDGSPGPNPGPGIDDNLAFVLGFLTGFVLSFGFLAGSACTYVYLRFFAHCSEDDEEKAADGGINKAGYATVRGGDA